MRRVAVALPLALESSDGVISENQEQCRMTAEPTARAARSRSRQRRSISAAELIIVDHSTCRARHSG
jgi:hypothetical protein